MSCHSLFSLFLYIWTVIYLKIEDYRKHISKKNIAVIGIGISNIPLIRFLVKSDVNLTAFDKRSKEEIGEVYDELSSLGVKFQLGDDYLSKIPENTDIIFKTPGMRYDIPELKKAVSKGAKLTSDTELFFELCPAEIIAVTGSDGKTTTTTLIYELLKKEGYKTFVGGNIGTPLFSDIELIEKEDKVVLELSSFQLHTLRKSPETAVITNITPNHLNWHIDYDEYIDSKKNIFKFANNKKTVLNYDNDITSSFYGEANVSVLFSRKTPLKDGFSLENGVIIKKENGEIIDKILDSKNIKIPGVHNIENYMAAIAATDGLVSKETINYIAENFGGVEHRIEFVREINKVRFYNDSIASTPARTTAGLLSFPDKVILIAGGYDKKIPFDDFGPVICDHVKELILVGNTSEKIKTAVLNSNNYNNLPIHQFSDFDKAIVFTKEIAKEGDVVLLSPACASFDMFKNFEERGNKFKEIVFNF